MNGAGMQRSRGAGSGVLDKKWQGSNVDAAWEEIGQIRSIEAKDPLLSMMGEMGDLDNPGMNFPLCERKIVPACIPTSATALNRVELSYAIPKPHQLEPSLVGTVRLFASRDQRSRL
jgi:hypothetical protein